MTTTHPPLNTEAPNPHAGPEPDGPRKSWAVLALAAQILVVLDITVVNTALPTIGRSLRLGSADLQWLVTATCWCPAVACCSAGASPTCSPDGGSS